MTDLYPRDWDWTKDTLICDVVIENRCVAGKVTYRAKKKNKLIFKRQDFDYQNLISALRHEGYIA